MVEYLFGAGAFWGNRTDLTGSGIGPDQFSVLQDISIDFGFDVRELHGQLSFPLDIARGKGKITGKAKLARIFSAIYGDLFFGSTPTTGMVTVNENEAQTVPATSTYNITVTNAANYLDDLGVFYAGGSSPGKRFMRVSSVTAVGQYSVNLSTGVYTFYLGDASANVLISYIWTSAATGKEIQITNQIMGYTPVFKGTFYTQKNTQGISGSMALILNACSSTRLAFPTTLDNYNIQELDFSAYDPGTGIIGTLSTTE